MPMPAPQKLDQDASGPAHAVEYATAGVVLTGVAGLIHLWVAPEHFHESWVVGTFFVLAGTGQVAFGAALVVFSTVTLLAIAVPARRAATVDPVEALRAE